MSRAKVILLWLILLLVPAVVVAQRDNTDRSRSRTESRRVEVDRSVERAKVVRQKGEGKNDRSRVGRNQVSQTKSDRVESNNRSRARRDQRAQRAGDSKVRRNRSGNRNSAPRYDRSPNVERKSSAPRDEKRKSSTRREVKRRASDRRDTRWKPVERKEVKRKPVRRKEDKHRRVDHKRRAVSKRHHHNSHVKKRHFRHSHKRYVYKHRRYHRHRSHRVSIGFYIRIPTVRWHVGHTRRFVYRQVVSGHPAGNVEILSTFKRRIRGVHRDYVDVEFELDRLEFLTRGQFLGEVDRFPGSLRKMRAKIYRDGFVQFDRMLYVVGNDYEGFELLSTRYCGGDLGRASDHCLDMRSGEIDFYDERVRSTRYSRLLGLARIGHAVPVALVPDEEYLGFQYVVGYGGSSDGYYSGSFDYSSLSRYDSDGTAYRLSAGDGIGGFEPAHGSWNGLSGDDGGFAHASVVSYQVENGAPLELQRQTEIYVVDD